MLDQIPDLADWPDADKKVIMAIIRAKMGPDEALYLRLLQQHPRLRQAVLTLGIGDRLHNPQIPPLSPRPAQRQGPPL